MSVCVCVCLYDRPLSSSEPKKLLTCIFLQKFLWWSDSARFWSLYSSEVKQSVRNDVIMTPTAVKKHLLTTIIAKKSQKWSEWWKNIQRIRPHQFFYICYLISDFYDMNELQGGCKSRLLGNIFFGEHPAIKKLTNLPKSNSMSRKPRYPLKFLNSDFCLLIVTRLKF